MIWHRAVELSVSLLLALYLGGFGIHHWLCQPIPIDESHRYWMIERGQSLNVLANRMRDAGLIKWPKIWVLYARFYAPKPVKAGEYLLDGQDSPLGILQRFQSGDVIRYQVTLVEGKTYQQWLDQLAQQPKLMKRVESWQVLNQAIGGDVTHPEGWFFPDTYQYVAGDSDMDILRRAHQRMKTVVAAEWKDKIPSLPYARPYDALIMASIIEKETGKAEERREIAGVFVRRLAKGMLLQTDPTVIYGLGADFDGNLTSAHLRAPTPYNTYVNPGLPPSPIAMPGKASIHAALHPAVGTSLYFVAKGDGSHQFSTTLEEHNHAVNLYQRRR
jgi:UPF0755 protein